MHLKSLKIFSDVVRHRSFSRAADENEISQSGASQLVHQLEERLGTKLIDRSKRPFVLTPEGRVFYEGCCTLVQDYDALEDRVRRLHREVIGRVRVASIYSVGLHHMNQHIQEFLARFPRANVRLEYLHPDRVYEEVKNDIADLGLVSYPQSSRKVEATIWREEPMLVVCSPGHRLAGAAQVSLADLDGEKAIGFDTDLTIRRKIDRLLQQRHVQLDVVMEFDNIETIKRAIEIDAGIGILPAPTVAREVQLGSLVTAPLDDVQLTRPIGIIHRRGRELSLAAERFIEILRSEPTETEAAAQAPVGDRSAAGDEARSSAMAS